MRILFIALFFLTGCSPKHFIKKEIGKTEQSLQEHLGFYLYDPSLKKTLIDYNGAKYFIPASNTKIFTLYTSLRLLGDSVASLKYVKHGDSLIFQGLGDPSFLYKNVFDNGRTYQFLKNFSGQLFFSPANFQTEHLGAGWAWDDYNFYYSAERSAFPMYGNLIFIKRLTENNLTFQPSFFSKVLHYSAEIHEHDEIIRGLDSNDLTYFSGKKKSNQTVPFHTNDSLAIALLSDTLHRAVTKINFPLTKDATVLKSIPSDSVYKVMMQDSDNFIAEQLLLQCAMFVSDTLKPEIAINYSKRNFLSDLPDAPQWVDGSGLSRLNLFTPRSIVFLWSKIYETVSRERLFKILAVSGQSGTLKNWYKADRPYIFGKTGSLSNNHCLSGFLFTKNGKLLLFSFMNNNFTVSGNDLRKQMENILKQVHDKL